MTRRRATIGGRRPAGSPSSRRRRGGGDLTRARRRRGRTSRCRGSASTTPRPRPANPRVRPRPAKRSATRTTPKITRGPARFALSPRRLGAGSPGTPRLTCPPRSRRRSNRGDGSASAAAAAAVRSARYTRWASTCAARWRASEGSCRPARLSRICGRYPRRSGRVGRRTRTSSRAACWTPCTRSASSTRGPSPRRTPRGRRPPSCSRCSAAGSARR
mmetsp:Transcript_12500/g.48722  ORF Transcript_12500/g.48722 Transcript_12500/m.48722 type:complete len:217 (-) Transcript_12500:1141-1791(-)